MGDGGLSQVAVSEIHGLGKKACVRNARVFQVQDHRVGVDVRVGANRSS